MRVSKQVFDYILGILENDELIDSFQYYKNENIVKVYSERNDAIYHFNKEDILINPEIYEVQHQIEDLKEKLNKLEEIKKNLLTKE